MGAKNVNVAKTPLILLALQLQGTLRRWMQYVHLRRLLRESKGTQQLQHFAAPL